jgi:hypothetical protein
MIMGRAHGDGDELQRDVANDDIDGVEYAKQSHDLGLFKRQLGRDIGTCDEHYTAAYDTRECVESCENIRIWESDENDLVVEGNSKAEGEVQCKPEGMSDIDRRERHGRMNERWW